jgi:hypothetical protein
MKNIKSYKKFNESLDLNSSSQYYRLIGISINDVSNNNLNQVILRGDTVTIYISCESGNNIEISGNINDINDDIIKSTVIDKSQIIFNFESGKSLKFTNELGFDDLKINIE